MGLFSKKSKNNNNDGDGVVEVTPEKIQSVKDEIFQGNYVEVQVPVVTSLTDNIMVAKEGANFFNFPYKAADGGVSTLWNVTQLYMNDYACSIELGGCLFPYNMIECVMHHPLKAPRYGLVLKTGEVVNFIFNHELARIAALEIFREHGVEVIG